MQPSKHYQRIPELIQSGKYHEALQQARKLSAKFPRDPESWYLLAGAHASLGQISDVIHCCKQVLTLNPHHTAALYNLAVALHHTGQLSEGLALYLRCIELNPTNSPALLGAGKIHQSKGDLASAFVCFKKAARSAPQLAEAHYYLGVITQALGKLSESVEHYRHALDIQPDYVEALNNLGHMMNELGHSQEAEKLFIQLTRMTPDSAQAHSNLGVVYDSTGKAEEAETSFKKAASLDPDFTPALNHLGFLLADQGRTEEAIRCFDNALSVIPNEEMALAGKANALEKRGQADAAAKIVEPAIKAGSCNPDIVLTYCRTQLRLGNLDTAVQHAAALLDSGKLPGKGISDLNRILGDLYDKKGDYDEAFEHYTRANQASPCTYNHQKHVDYIDRIINHSQPGLINEPHRKRKKHRNIIFIIGMPRSGTSLVEQILSSHPDVYGAGELRCMGEIANRPNLATASGPYPQGMPELEASDVDNLAQEYIAYLESIGDGSSSITDKMPHNFLYLGLIHLLFPNARIVHIKRNPLDTCLSLYFQGFNPLHSYTTDLGLLVKYYLEYERLMEHWRSCLEIPMLEINYETIVNGLETSTRNLLDFCNLPWSTDCLRFHENNRFVQTPSYNQVRQPIYKSSTGRWKNYRKFIGPLTQSLKTDPTGSDD